MVRPRLRCVPRFFVPLLALAAHLSARSAYGQEGSAPPSLKLDSGLTVLLREDATRPEVAIQLDFNVGSDDDPASAEGSAWLLAQYLARPTNRMFNAEKQEALFRALGAGAFSPKVTTMQPIRQGEVRVWRRPAKTTRGRLGRGSSLPRRRCAFRLSRLPPRRP